MLGRLLFVRKVPPMSFAAAPSADNPDPTNLFAHVTPGLLASLISWEPPAARLTEATEALQKAIPNLVAATFAGAGRQQAQQAVLIQSLLGANPTLRDISCALQAVTAFMEGQTAKAVLWLDQAIALQPACAAYLHLRGLFAVASGDAKTCAKMCRAARTIDPGYAPAAFPLALIETLQQNWGAVRPLIDQARAQATPAQHYVLDLCLLASGWRQQLPNESPWSLDAFDPSLTQSKPDFSFLPPLDRPWPSLKTGQKVFFVYADVHQLIKNVLPLAASLGACGAPSFHLHVHIASPRRDTPQMIEDLAQKTGLSLSWTTERFDPFQAGNIGLYHASVRLIRFFQFIEGTNHSACLLDADALFARTPEALSFFDGPADVALPLEAHAPLWDYCAAPCIFARPSPGGLLFLETLSRFIGQNLQAKTLTWHSARLGLSLAADFLAARLRLESLTGIETPYNDASQAILLNAPGQTPEGCARYQTLHTAFADQVKDIARRAERPMTEHTAWVSSFFGPMMVNRHDTCIGPAIHQKGLWAEDELLLLRPLIRPGDTLIDVGANIGMHTLAFATWVGAQGRVHTFEPQRAIFDLLTQTIAENALTNVCLHLEAVGAETGSILVPTVDYTQSNNFGALSLVTDSPQHSQIKCDVDHGEKVPLVRLDDLNLTACRLIKIDVEKMEPFVLQGAQDLITRLRPFVYLEFHSNQEAILAFFEAHGYNVALHNSDNPNLLATPKELATS